MANDHYKYEPSMAAAVIFIVGFVLSGLFHTWQVARLRSWYFIPFIIGCAGTFCSVRMACHNTKAVAHHEVTQLRQSDMEAEPLMRKRIMESGLKGLISSKPFFCSSVRLSTLLPSTWFSVDLSDSWKLIDSRLSD